MEEAIEVIEKVVQNHIYAYGHEDKRTQQNVLHAVELLNGWNRQADALGLLSLSKELLQPSPGPRNAQRADGRAGKKRKAVQTPNQNGSQSDLATVLQSVNEDLSPARVDYGLGVARTHVAAKDEVVKGFLLVIISQCESHPDLGIQHLKARAELFKFYDKMGLTDEHQAEFEDALESVNKTWEAYNWEEDTIESLDFMEASLQFGANILKSGY